MAGDVWDDANRQVVRADQSASWDEGSGGAAAGPKNGVFSLDDMTKPELLDYARERGASPANNDMTKEELRASIEAAGG
jgi:hypothetical protein